MKEIIATGKTVDLAIEEACQQLGVPREKAEFEIIDLPKKGLFGLKTYPAKVRVFVKEDKAEMAVEYISSILRAMGAQSFSATPSLEGENLHITLQGDDLGFVIGRRGETIDAHPVPDQPCRQPPGWGLHAHHHRQRQLPREA